LDKHCIEDVTYSTTNQFVSINNCEQTIKNQITPPPSPEEQQQQNSIEIKTNLIEISKEEEKQQENISSIKTMINYSADSSDESWRLLNSNSSLDEHIPYIDETDFEDLGNDK
jgi:hypothetical protein